MPVRKVADLSSEQPAEQTVSLSCPADLCWDPNDASSPENCAERFGLPRFQLLQSLFDKSEQTFPELTVGPDDVPSPTVIVLNNLLTEAQQVRLSELPAQVSQAVAVEVRFASIAL